MNETKRTLIYVAVAVVAVGAASVTHYATRPKQDSDSGRIGKQFYEEFQDPTAAQVLKVVAYDEKSAQVKPFKVEYRGGKWLIPSHHNYPADAKDRLAKTAASVIGTTRGAFVTRLKSQYANYNVVDPEDPDTTLLKGRGDKITLSKSDGTVLAEYIVGKKVEGQTDAYYVRCPKADEDPDSVYIAKLKIDLTTKFADWIEPDLLKVDRENLTDIRIDNYSIDEQRSVIVPGKVSELTRKQSADPWKLAGLNDKEELKTEAVNQLVSSLDGLRIVGVRPKPPGVKPDLSLDRSVAQSPDAVMVLRSNMMQRGYYLARAEDGNGTRVVSKEGEVEAGTNEGVRYLLNFGQIFAGSEFEIETGLSKDTAKKGGDKKDAAKTSAEADKKTAEGDDKAKQELKKNRYLMVYTRFDPKLLGEPPVKPSEPKKPEGVVLNAPGNSAMGKTSTAHSSPAAKSAKGTSGTPAPAKPGNKRSSIDRQTDDKMLALAFADSKEQSPANPATKKPDPPSPPSAASKSAPATKAPAKGAAAAKPAPATKPAPPKPDPKAEYQKSMSQYKKDLEKYENDKSEYEKKLKKGEEKVKQLNERFGPWYYVISAESFENLRLSRASLVGPKEKPTTGEPKAPALSFPSK